jgi:hypothetical protein
VRRDFVFTLPEQRNPGIERDAKVVELKAGHVEVIGDADTVPVKLIAVLRQYAVFAPTGQKLMMTGDDSKKNLPVTTR